jgi:membrane protease YdiL (CAAX protease family)
MIKYKLHHVLLIIALILFAGITLLWIFNQHILNPLPNQEFYLLIMILIVIYLVTAKAYATNDMLIIHKAIGFHKVRYKMIFIALVITILIFLIDYLYQIKLLTIDMTAQATDWKQGQSNLSATFLTTVIFTPIIEEMLFRGVLLKTLNKYINKFLTALIVSILFVSVHASIIAAPTLFIAALFYAWLTFKSQSIIPAIIAHIVNNGLTFYYYIFLLNA